MLCFSMVTMAPTASRTATWTQGSPSHSPSRSARLIWEFRRTSIRLELGTLSDSKRDRISQMTPIGSVIGPEVGVRMNCFSSPKRPTNRSVPACMPVHLGRVAIEEPTPAPETSSARLSPEGARLARPVVASQSSTTARKAWSAVTCRFSITSARASDHRTAGIFAGPEGWRATKRVCASVTVSVD